jgi:hypothetical protein
MIHLYSGSRGLYTVYIKAYIPDNCLYSPSIFGNYLFQEYESFPNVFTHIKKKRANRAISIANFGQILSRDSTVDIK